MKGMTVPFPLDCVAVEKPVMKDIQLHLQPITVVGWESVGNRGRHPGKEHQFLKRKVIEALPIITTVQGVFQVKRAEVFQHHESIFQVQGMDFRNTNSSTPQKSSYFNERATVLTVWRGVHQNPASFVPENPKIPASAGIPKYRIHTCPA